MEFVSIEKKYPDYFVYAENGKHYRIHIDFLDSITVFGFTNRRLQLHGRSISAVRKVFPVIDSLITGILTDIPDIKNYCTMLYHYYDTCLSLDIDPYYFNPAIISLPKEATCKLLIKITQQGRERGWNDKEIKARVYGNVYALTEEEAEFYVQYIDRHDFLKNDFLEKQKLRNLFLKMCKSAVAEVIGVVDVADYVINYAYFCHETGMPIETGDFWTNYKKAERTYQAMRTSIEAKKFREAQTKHNLFYENEDFTIIVPTEKMECIEEGMRLNNCLGSIEWDVYLSNGTRCVVFIRKKNSPERSYIACDITQDGKIVQFLSYNNREVRSEKALNFKKEYQQYLSTIWYKAH